ncbi:MAG: sigma-70 family RNA polymerase sigma factor [Planctomycetales bacterium]|nr:sigma-70 family RNA polymerase sigma factor [Planctomycetales bacterium]
MVRGWGIWDGAQTLVPITQSSLIDHVRNRDPAAWGKLVDLYGPLIAYWCGQCGMDTHATADCTQDVFAAVSRAIDVFRPANSTGSFRVWLWTITANKIKDRARKESRNVLGTGGSTAMRRLNEIPDQLSVPDDEPTKEAQVNELVARGLGQIRSEFADKTWQIFQRSVIDDQTTAQVAQEFGVSPATVRQSRSRILRRLRQHLGDIE